MDEKLKTTMLRQETNYQMLSFRKDPSQVMVTFDDGTDFGILNTGVMNALESLTEKNLVFQLDVFTDIGALRQTLGKVKKDSDAIARININLYGSKATGRPLGRQLSAQKVFLQCPYHQREGTEYRNPQVIPFPGLDSSVFNELQSIRAEKSTLPSTDHFEKAISDVYKSLKRSSNLSQVEGEYQLRTPLLASVYHLKQLFTFY